MFDGKLYKYRGKKISPPEPIKIFAINGDAVAIRRKNGRMLSVWLDTGRTIIKVDEQVDPIEKITNFYREQSKSIDDKFSKNMRKVIKIK